jgi:hypothetical protein
MQNRAENRGGHIDPAFLVQVRKTGPWGLQGMRERTTLIGGNLEVWSQIDGVTEIHLSVPAESAYLTSQASKLSALLHAWRGMQGKWLVLAGFLSAR